VTRAERLAPATAKWIGTGAGVSGATLIALNLGVVGYGLVLFLVSSLLWAAVGFAQRDQASSCCRVRSRRSTCSASIAGCSACRDLAGPHPAASAPARGRKELTAPGSVWATASWGAQQR
jgi:hypothetical protein